MPHLPTAIAAALALVVLFTLPGCRQSGAGDFWAAVSKEVRKQETK